MGWIRFPQMVMRRLALWDFRRFLTVNKKKTDNMWNSKWQKGAGDKDDERKYYNCN